MSLYLSIGTGIDNATLANSSALPNAAQVVETERAASWRLASASVLRRLARVQVAAAGRLERPVGSRLAAA